MRGHIAPGRLVSDRVTKRVTTAIASRGCWQTVVPGSSMTHGWHSRTAVWLRDEEAAKLGQAGVHVDSGLLHSFEDATQVQVNDAGERLVTNGPFAESREYLGGYQIIDVPDLDAALDWAARCPARSTGASRCVRSPSSEDQGDGAGRRTDRGSVPRGARPSAGPARGPIRRPRSREEVTAEALLAA